MTLPELTEDQRTEALQKAAEARRLRAETKRKLKAGETSVSELLERAETDDALAKMRVREMLESLPRIGPLRAEELMKEHKVAASRRVRGLGRHQREALVKRFG